MQARSAGLILLVRYVWKRWRSILYWIWRMRLMSSLLHSFGEVALVGVPTFFLGRALLRLVSKSSADDSEEAAPPLRLVKLHLPPDLGAAGSCLPGSMGLMIFFNISTSLGSTRGPVAASPAAPLSPSPLSSASTPRSNSSLTFPGSWSPCSVAKTGAASLGASMLSDARIKAPP